MIPGFYQEAINALTAPWWEVWLVRIFGIRAIVDDEFTGMTVKIYYWRGNGYMVDATAARQQESK